MKNILLALFSASYVMAANPLETQAHHYMTVHDKFGTYYNDDLLSYSGGMGQKIQFFNLNEEHDVTYCSIQKKIKIEFRDCIQKPKKVQILSIAKDNTFIFERCSKDFFESKSIIFKRNPYSDIDEQTMLLKIIFKECSPPSSEKFLQSFLSEWPGKNIQILGKEMENIKK